MFIAHLPAAYLLSHCHPTLSRLRPAFLVGALLPDADMLVFYLWDHGSVHHHDYLTHRPIVWAALLGIGLIRRSSWWGRQAAVISIGALTHLMLDSIAGNIAWGWPVTAAARPLIAVPATQDWWVMSFVLHWTFAVEILICLLALWVLPRRVP